MTDKKYTLEEYCRVVAFLINCDIEKYATDPIKTGYFTAEKVYNSNSQGELFGVINSCRYAQCVMESAEGEFKDVLIRVAEGEELIPSVEYSTNVGYLCLTHLYKMSDSFVKMVNNFFDEKNTAQKREINPEKGTAEEGFRQTEGKEQG